MALNYNQVRNTALDNQQIEEVLAIVMALVARDVLAEAPGLRRDLAVRVLVQDDTIPGSGPIASAQRLKWIVLTSATLTSPVLPGGAGGLAAAVVAEWTLMAGV